MPRKTPRTITFQPDEAVRRGLRNAVVALAGRSPKMQRGVRSRLINEALRRRYLNEKEAA